MASHTIFDQSTFPNLQCDMPDTAVVPTSPRWTAVEAIAGVRPATPTNKVEDVAP